MTVPDQINRSVLLSASIERVFSAISNSSEFGVWFGVEFDGPFIVGQSMLGRIRPTQVDADVAKLQVPHTGKPFNITIERVEPPRLFSFRWHPFAIDPAIDYTQEPTTLVEFELTEVTLKEGGRGTLLNIRESGFDKIPLERRAEAFSANDGGWEHQSRLVAKYLELYPS